MSDSPVTAEVSKPTVYVCHLDGKYPLFHPCAKVEKAMDKAGIDYDKVVYGEGKPFGRGTEGTRPDVKEISGQEKLPLLVLPGGKTVAGSKEIISWARDNKS